MNRSVKTDLTFVSFLKFIKLSKSIQENPSIDFKNSLIPKKRSGNTNRSSKIRSREKCLTRNGIFKLIGRKLSLMRLEGKAPQKYLYFCPRQKNARPSVVYN